MALFALSMLLAFAQASQGCTAAQKATAEDRLAAVGESAAKQCVLDPVRECAWGDGWESFRDCATRAALPCLGGHVAGLLPLAVDLARDALSVRYAGPVYRTTALAEAAACIGTLPEPTVDLCGDVALPECGAWGIARCVERAAVGVAVAVSAGP